MIPFIARDRATHGGWKQIVAITISMVAAIAVTLTPSLSAAAAPPQEKLKFSVDIGDFFYPYASQADNRSALDLMMRRVEIVGHYSHYVDKMVWTRGGGCGRDVMGPLCGLPHWEKSSEQRNSPLSLKVVGIAAKPGGPWHLEFSLPASRGGGALSSIELNLPAAALWQQASFRQSQQMARKASFPISDGASAFSIGLVDAGPDLDPTHFKACTLISDRSDVASLNLRASMNAADGRIHTYTATGGSPRPTCVADTADPLLPAAGKFEPMPTWAVASLICGNEETRHVALPASDTRWGDSTRGSGDSSSVTMNLTRCGPVTWLEMSADTGSTARSTAPSASHIEHWILHDGRVAAHDGAIPYPRANDAAIQLVWQVKLVDGEKLDAWSGHGGMFAARNVYGWEGVGWFRDNQLCALNADCKAQICTREDCFSSLQTPCPPEQSCQGLEALASATAARAPAEIQTEVERYLRLFEQAPATSVGAQQRSR